MERGGIMNGKRPYMDYRQYRAASGNDCVCHAAALRRWLNREKKEKPKKGIPDYSYKEGESL